MADGPNSGFPPEVRERARLTYWLDQANIPKDLQSLDWFQFESTPMEKVADFAFELATEWANETSHRGISLFGMPGRGKTTLAATMLCGYIDATVPTTVNGLFSEDVKGYFITLADYHRLYLRAYELDKWAQRAPGEANAAYAEWESNFALRRFIEEEVPHLVLDDVGNEHHTASGAVEAAFHTLLRGRYTRGLSTSITSNLALPKFVKYYGEPQFSYLHEVTRVFQITGGRDFRGSPKRGGSS